MPSRCSCCAPWIEDLGPCNGHAQTLRTWNSGIVCNIRATLLPQIYLFIRRKVILTAKPNDRLEKSYFLTTVLHKFSIKPRLSQCRFPNQSNWCAAECHLRKRHPYWFEATVYSRPTAWGTGLIYTEPAVGGVDRPCVTSVTELRSIRCTPVAWGHVLFNFIKKTCFSLILYVFIYYPRNLRYCPFRTLCTGV